MNRIWKWCWIMTVSVMLSGCMGRGTGPGDIPGKTFGVLNSFPKAPIYLKNKTLEVTRRVEAIESLSLKSQLTASAIHFLRGKGYRVVPVEDRSALEKGTVDMLIEIVPRQVHKISGMEAYGFSDREILLGLVKQPAVSFVALQLVFSRKNSPRIIRTHTEERFSRLEKNMPDTWEALSEDDKGAFEQNLKENLAKAVYLSLSRLKI